MKSETAGKRPFYKYASPETALAILRNAKVRYSAPRSFNDPFDVQSGLHFDFDIDALHERLIGRLQELAAAPIAPAVDQDDVWGKLVLQARKCYPTHGFPKDRWRALTADPFASLVEVFRTTQQEYQSHWWNKLLPGVRVFCVSEDRDNLLMWAHYARDHTGAVFELWSLPEEDNPLSVARAVEYQDAPPVFFTEREWLDDLTGMGKLDFTALYQRYAFVKSSHWSYEREWRVWYPLADENTSYDDLPLRPSEFASLYLGCRAAPAFARETIELVKKSFPNVRIFRASRKQDAYALEHTEI